MTRIILLALPLLAADAALMPGWDLQKTAKDACVAWEFKKNALIDLEVANIEREMKDDPKSSKLTELRKEQIALANKGRPVPAFQAECLKRMPEALRPCAIDHKAGGDNALLCIDRRGEAAGSSAWSMTTFAK